MDISKPQNIQLKNHVYIDVNAPSGNYFAYWFILGISGIPPEWQTVLESSDISKEEMDKNESALLEVLKFHFNGIDNLLDTIPSNSLSDGKEGISTEWVTI